jgi:hypothetical protein
MPEYHDRHGSKAGGIPLEEAREAAQVWGNNPVHSSQAAYKLMVEVIMSDVANPEARHSNPPKQNGPPPAKKPKYDQSLPEL